MRDASVVLQMVMFIALCGCPKVSAEDAGCEETGDAETFSAPSGVAVFAQMLFVANTNFWFEGSDVVYGPSEVVVVDIETLAVLRRIPTSAPNAQFLTVAPSDPGNASVYVVSSGPSSYDGIRVLPTGPGAVDRLDVVDGAPPDAVAASITIPAGGADPRLGFPSRLALAGGGTVGLLGSGTAGVVFRVDLVAATLIETVSLFDAPLDINASAEVRVAGGRTHVLGFNDDLHCVQEGDDGSLSLATLTCADIGASPQLEGPLDMALLGDDRAFVVMSLANAVYEVDLSGPAPQRAAIHPVGVAPNRIVAAGGALLVVVSGSNNLWRLAGAGEAEVVAVMCPGTNPFDLAVAGERAYVSGLLSNSIVIMDLSSGAVVDTIR